MDKVLIVFSFQVLKDYNNVIHELDLKEEDIYDLKAERANIKVCCVSLNWIYFSIRS